MIAIDITVIVDARQFSMRILHNIIHSKMVCRYLVLSCFKYLADFSPMLHFYTSWKHQKVENVRKPMVTIIVTVDIIDTIRITWLKVRSITIIKITTRSINPFYSSVTFPYPLKTSENQRFFQWVQKCDVGLKWVNRLIADFFIQVDCMLLAEAWQGHHKNLRWSVFQQ